MIILGIQGIKKGRKKYKQHQAEKERKLLESRGQLPDIQDPSRELDVTCLAEGDSKDPRPSGNLGRTASTGSDSTKSAEEALENDPNFQQYMERQRQLYIQGKANSISSPPSYDASVQNTPLTAQGQTSSLSPNSTHCSCHECLQSSTTSPLLTRHPADPVHYGQVHQGTVHHASANQGSVHGSIHRPQHLSYVSELPASIPENTAVPVEIDGRHLSNAQQPVEADSTPIIFELPGNLPAILPESKPTRIPDTAK